MTAMLRQAWAYGDAALERSHNWGQRAASLETQPSGGRGLRCTSGLADTLYAAKRRHGRGVVHEVVHHERKREGFNGSDHRLLAQRQSRGAAARWSCAERVRPIVEAEKTFRRQCTYAETLPGCVAGLDPCSEATR